MEKNLESQGICKKEKEILPTADRCEIQCHLIEEFCAMRSMSDAKERNICALDWVEKYADNLDDVDGELFNRYKKSETDEEKDAILDEIQSALEILDKMNG
jgi:hypothetical protein